MTPERKEIITLLIERHLETVEAMEELATQVELIREQLAELRTIEERLYEAVRDCVSDE